MYMYTIYTVQCTLYTLYTMSNITKLKILIYKTVIKIKYINNIVYCIMYTTTISNINLRCFIRQSKIHNSYF